MEGKWRRAIQIKAPEHGISGFLQRIDLGLNDLAHHRKSMKHLSLLFVLGCAFPAGAQSTIPTSYQGAAIYDLTNKLPATGIGYKMHTFENVLGRKFSLDLTGFAGITNERLPVAALTLGKTFPAATFVNVYFGLGGDQIQTRKRTGFCAQGGINWAFQG
jgi:hypothetical protein